MPATTPPPFRLLALLALVLAACSSEPSSAQPSPAGQTAAAPLPHPAAGLYLNYCAGCHGRALDGGNGGALLEPGDFQHGTAPEALFKSIHDGIPALGMPAYGGVLSREQVESLADYVLTHASGTIQPAPPPTTRPGTKRRDNLNTYDYVVGVEVWAEGLDIPWGIAFTGPDEALVTERPGRLRRVVNGLLQPDPVRGTPDVWVRGQGGLLDVAVDPEHAENGWVYLAYSHPANDGAMTRLVRGRIQDNAWTGEQVLFEAPARSYSSGGVHFGCRIVFPPDGYLYFCVGERGVQNRAQDLSLPNGKVFRLHRDGRVPDDNPFLDTPGALPQIFSYGHRNPQGMAVHPVTGDVWATEHGPRGGDELNIIRPGANYGWPEITYGINYNGTIITRERVRPGMEQPVWVWRPSTGTCGLDWYTGTEFPNWTNHLLAGGLASRDVRLLMVQDDRVIHEEIILSGRRTRAVKTGPDGAIYVLVENPGEILRLTRVAEQTY